MIASALLLAATVAAPAEPVVPFATLAAQEVKIKAELQGVHPRVFVTASELAALRERARTTHKAVWTPVLSHLAALQSDPPAPPGPQERRAQNTIAYAIAEVSFAYAIERKPEYLQAARRWVLAAIDYEPWGYTYYKPNVDLAAGHLLYAIGWSYDLLYDDFTEAERARIRTSLTRHAQLMYDFFKPAPDKRWAFTQNHTYIPTAGLAVAALALMGEVPEAPQWAALARALHHRLGQCLSPDGYFFEGPEYWTFAAPWIVHFLDAWEHSTGESLWDRDFLRNWKVFFAHVILPDGLNVFDFGDAWEGATTRARTGEDYARAFPGGKVQSNYNLLYRVASRLNDGATQAVAAQAALAGQSNMEEYWTLIWRDDALRATSEPLPLFHHFEDSGVVFDRTGWGADATAFAFKAGPPEGHRAAQLRQSMPEWRLDDGHVHPDNGSFIVYARGRYLTGDSGYAGVPRSADHNTITIGGVGQGASDHDHDVWRGLPYDRADAVRITEAKIDGSRVSLAAECAGAYADAAGLQRFTRTFTFDGKDTFRIEDHIETASPKIVQWRLGSDTPITSAHGAYVLGEGLEVRVKAPAKAKETVAPLLIHSPGLPGSIEKGETKARGHQLTLENPSPAATIAFDVTLRVQ
jgi:hypothetical protein